MATTKLFVRNILRQSDLKDGQVVVSGRHIDFVWIQGIIVDLNLDTREMIIDDGTDTILISTEDLIQEVDQLRIGSYIMIQGVIIIGEDDFGKVVLVRARLLYDLSPSILSDTNLETLWQYEVMESLRNFYQM